MGFDEVNDILERISKLNPKKMSSTDTIYFALFCSKFAEGMKPIVDKYVPKEPKDMDALLRELDALRLKSREEYENGEN